MEHKEEEEMSARIIFEMSMEEYEALKGHLEVALSGQARYGELLRDQILVARVAQRMGALLSQDVERVLSEATEESTRIRDSYTIEQLQEMVTKAMVASVKAVLAEGVLTGHILSRLDPPLLENEPEPKGAEMNWEALSKAVDKHRGPLYISNKRAEEICKLLEARTSAEKMRAEDVGDVISAANRSRIPMGPVVKWAKEHPSFERDDE